MGAAGRRDGRPADRSGCSRAARYEGDRRQHPGDAALPLPPRAGATRHASRCSTYPVGLGRDDWRTPRGRFKVRGKTVNPQLEHPGVDPRGAHRASAATTARSIPGGDPDNPLGKYRIELDDPAVRDPRHQHPLGRRHAGEPRLRAPLPGGHRAALPAGHRSAHGRIRLPAGDGGTTRRAVSQETSNYAAPDASRTVHGPYLVPGFPGCANRRGVSKGWRGDRRRRGRSPTSASRQRRPGRSARAHIGWVTHRFGLAPRLRFEEVWNAVVERMLRDGR